MASSHWPICHPRPQGTQFPSTRWGASEEGLLHPGVAPKNPNLHLNKESQPQPSLPWQSLGPGGSVQRGGSQEAHGSWLGRPAVAAASRSPRQ